MTDELIVPESNQVMLRDSDILNPNYNFDDKIEVATKVATSLNKVIESQGLAVTLGKKPDGTPNKYVTAEGWEVLGTMLGCTPYVEEVVEIPSNKKGYFSYKAVVSIRHGNTILAKAEAIAERNNKQRERPFVYSMAQTRALGKAYRMALSWIIKMAGYEPTPAEEMPRFKPDDIVEAEVMEKFSVPKKEHSPVFETADNIEPIDVDPVTENFVKTLIRELHEDGLRVSKNNIIKQSFSHLKKKEITSKAHKDVIDWCKDNCPDELETLESEIVMEEGI